LACPNVGLRISDIRNDFICDVFDFFLDDDDVDDGEDDEHDDDDDETDGDLEYVDSGEDKNN
jgi:hypothetical protein